MIWVVLVLLVLALGASVWLNVITIRRNLQLNDQREELVDQIEESLDLLDDCYDRLARNADIPVLSDEPVIREVVADIKRARNTVLAIASKVVTYGADRGADAGDE